MEIRDRDFEEEVLKVDKPVLVDFWGSWCIPCKKMEPILEKINNKYKGELKICSLNINRNPKTPVKYEIKGVPTYIIFYNGKPVKREIGAKSEKQLNDFIKNTLIKTLEKT